MELQTPIEARRISVVAEKVFEANRGSSLKEGPRAYIGASILGHHCDRYIWLNFRWAFYYQTPNSGRLELLFQRGKNEEWMSVATLRDIGLDPIYVLNDQLDIDFGCHVKCHPDGVIMSGVPDAPKAIHNLELKTANDKNFKEIVKNGCEKAKPMHYIQQMIEMYGEKYVAKIGDVQRSLYYVTNKNDDDRYTERLALDKAIAEQFIERGKRLALMDEIPPRCSEHPDWYECKMCPFHEACHGDMLPEINCRTCAHSTPKEDGTWYCEYWKDTIPLKAQRKGCECHVIHPDLVEKVFTWYPKESTDWSAKYMTPVGPVLNGYEGEATLPLMRRILKKVGKDDSYLDAPYRIEAVPDENTDIPF